MSDRAALVAAVAAVPDDDLPKLVLADWLDEHGDPDRAEFIRLQVAAYRDSQAFPPREDAERLVRIRDLFLANYERWLGPVYEPLGLPLPAFRSGEAATLLGRLARGVLRVVNPLSALPTFDPQADRWHVMSTGALISHPLDRPLTHAVFVGGGVGGLHLFPNRLPPGGDLARAFAAEPVTSLTVRLTPDLASWLRFDGPHLNRVSDFNPMYDGGGLAEFDPIARAVCSGDHWQGLRSLSVSAYRTGSGPDDHDGRGSLFDHLRTSPLRRQLDTLSLYAVNGVAEFLADPDGGFDALRRLSVSIPGDGTGANPFPNGVGAALRSRLTRLTSTSTPCPDAEWVVSGPPWERLETLWMHSNGLGDAGAAALARSMLFPTLKVLRSVYNGIGEAGAVALAGSPLVERLDCLALDGNAVGDAGAEALAGALDRGLGYLSVANQDPAISAGVVKRLGERYGPRIAFTAPRYNDRRLMA